MPVTECVSADQLKSYALGRLENELADQVSSHLKNCVECEETLSRFDDTNDSLLQHIRTAEPNLEGSPASLQAALEGIATLRSEAAESRPQPSTSVDWVRDYRLIDQLGQGGMGTVYKAVHEKLQRTVALKLLPARRLRNREAVGRFEREMRAIGRLDHPAIVRATDAGEFEGTHFLAMDFVNGIDLGKVVRLTGPLSIPDACEVIRVTATGLSYAHNQGLIHRDVKPSNIMLALSDNGDAVSVKLLDLGLALFGAASEAVDDFTTVGQLMGTLDYMAPEQADHSHVTATADVYSLGATLFKLLTGKAPFESERAQNPLQKMKVLATTMAPSLSDRAPDAPSELIAVVDLLLQRNTEDRIALAAEVADAMQPFCEGHQLQEVAAKAMTLQQEERNRQEVQLSESVPQSAVAAKFGPLSSAVKPAVAQMESGGNNFRWKRWLAGFAGAPLLAFLGVIIWVQTDRGTLKIESVADDIPIEIRQGQAVVESFTLKSGPNEISLRSGRHEVSIAANYDQLQMSNNTIEIQRGGQTLVRVEYVAKGGDRLFPDATTTQGQSRPPKKTLDPLDSPKANSLIFEGRTYAEWKNILHRERSPEELIKGIDALAALSDDSNAAETGKAILKIMDRFQAVPHEYSIESQVLKSGARRIRELDPETVEPVLRAALGTISANIDTLILGELCNFSTLLYGDEPPPGDFGGANSTGPSGPIEPLRKVLFQSEEFIEAAFRSWPNWGAGDVRTSLSNYASGVLYQMISARRAGQKPLTPAMLDFCKQVVEQGMNPDSGVDVQPAMIVLLEVTDREGLPDLQWNRMTSQEAGSSYGWQQLAKSPFAIRKMLPLLKANITQDSQTVLKGRLLGARFNGGFRGEPVNRNLAYFFRSTLIVELMGSAGKDSISCQQLLSDQLMLHTGAIPAVDGVHTFQAADNLICTQLNSLETAKTNTQDGAATATLRHIQALLWAWEKITGEPAKFVEPVFPKLAEFPAELQPKVLAYKGKTIDEWAEYDGSDFESWEAEIARYQFLETLRTQDGVSESVQEAQERIAEHAVLEFRDDSAWFKLVHQLLRDQAIDNEAAGRFDKMLQTVNTAQCAQLLTECFVRLSDATLRDDTTSKNLSTRLGVVALGYSDDGRSQGHNLWPMEAAAISRLIHELQRLPMRQQREVLMRVNFCPLPLSLEAQNRIKRLSDSPGELQVLATLAAGRQFKLSRPDREQVINRLIAMLEQPDEDNTDWLNAAVSLGVAVTEGITEQQMQRLLKMLADKNASKCFNLVWNHEVPFYSEVDADVGDKRLVSPLGYNNVTESVVVSRRVLVLQILTELFAHQPERKSVPVLNADFQVIFELAQTTAGWTPNVVSPKLTRYASDPVAYVRAVHPSDQTDQAVASEWAARVLVAAGMMVRE